MKKFIALLAVLCMMLSMTGCLGEDLMTKYENAVEKTNALRQIDMDLKLNISQKSKDSGGSSYSVDVPADMNIKAKLNEDDTINSMSMTMSMSVLSENIEFNIIYVDEVTYVSISSASIGEQKFKVDGDINDAQNSEYNISVEDMSSAFMLEDYIDEDILADSDVEKSDGNTTIKLKLSASKMTKLLEDLMEEFGSVLSAASGSTSSSLFGDDGSFKITDSNIKLVIDKEGYISKTNFDITSEATVFGVSCSTDIKIKQSLNNPGEDVVINAPADKESYQPLSVTQPGIPVPGLAD